MIGAFIAMQYHALVIAVTFAAAAAFNVATYAAAVLISALNLNRSGPAGAESALRLLLGTRSEKEKTHAFPARLKAQERDKRMTRQDTAAQETAERGELHRRG